MSTEKQSILETVVRAADAKKAEDIIALDMRGISILADYFVIMHGNSERQVGAIMNGIRDAASEHGFSINRIEGQEGGTWILMDAGEVIIHIFQHETRTFYNLERLWSDAPLVDVGDWMTE